MNIELETLQRLAQTWLPILLDAAVKGTVLLAVAALTVTAMKKTSAAARQLVWVLALTALLALPLTSAYLPGWQVLPGWTKLEMPAPQEPQEAQEAQESQEAQPVMAASEDLFRGTNLSSPPADAAPDPWIGHESEFQAGTEPRTAAPMPSEAPTIASHEPSPAPAAAPPPKHSPWAMVLPAALGVWAVGTIVCLLPLVLGHLSLWRLARASRRISDASWIALARRAARAVGFGRDVILLQSDQEPMPMVWGILRPRLLLPTEAENWSADRRWVVLLHELAHTRRNDCLTKMIAHVACSLYWFNPLCWVAFKFMQREAEAACDDLVLSAGHRPSDYATHLLEIASGLKSGLLTAYSSIAMARKSKLEGRLLAILDPKRNRRALTRIGALIAVLLIVGLVVPISIMKATAENKVTVKPDTEEPATSTQPGKMSPTEVLFSLPKEDYRGAAVGLTKLSVWRKNGVIRKKLHQLPRAELPSCVWEHNPCLLPSGVREIGPLTVVVKRRGGSVIAIRVNGKNQPLFDGVYAPTISSNGKHWAYGAVSFATKKQFVILDGKKQPEFDWVSGVVFSPDGNRWAYAAGNKRKTFVVIDGVMGPQRISHRPATVKTYTDGNRGYNHYHGGRAIQWSPDSKHMVYRLPEGLATKANSRDFCPIYNIDHKPISHIPSKGLGQWSANSKRYAYIGESQDRKRPWKKCVVLDGKPLSMHSSIVHYAFSPDSKRLAYYVSDGKCKVFSEAGASRLFDWPMVGGKLSWVHNVTGVVFSADSKHLAYVARERMPRDKWYVVLDGKKREEYDDILTVPTFHDGCLVYVAVKRSEKEVKVLLVRDRFTPPSATGNNKPVATRPAKKWMVTNPVGAIKAVLPKGLVIQKVVKNAHPFYLEPGKGKAIYIGKPLNQIDMKNVKVVFSTALWIMPANYQGKSVVGTDTTQASETPQLIAITKNAKLYGWGCKGELRKKILKALLLKSQPIMRSATLTYVDGIKPGKMPAGEKVWLILQKGKLLRDVWNNEISLAGKRKGGDSRTPQERKKHADEAKKTFDRAVAVFKEVRASDPRFGLADEAVFYLSVLYEEARMHDECIRACEELLNKYPNARLSGIVGKRHQFNTYRRLGDAYAGLGRHEKASEAYVRSLLSAESIRYWHSGMNRLLQYEMQTKKRAKLPKELQAKLDKARKDSPVLISLTLDTPVKKSGGPVQISYKIHNRTDKPIRDFRLVFHLLFNNMTGTTADAMYDQRLGRSDEIVVPAGQIVKGTATVWIDHAWIARSSMVLARMERVVIQAAGSEAWPSAWTKSYWSDPLWVSGVGAPATKPVKVPADKDTAKARKVAPVPGPVSIWISIDEPVKKLSGPIRLNYKIHNQTQKTLGSFRLVFYRREAGYGLEQHSMPAKYRYQYIGRVDDVVVPAGKIVKGTAMILPDRDGAGGPYVVVAITMGYVVKQANGTSGTWPPVRMRRYSSNPLSLKQLALILEEIRLKRIEADMNSKEVKVPQHPQPPVFLHSIIEIPKITKAEALVEKLVAQLGDRRWKVREEATAKLKGMGTGVISLLKKYRDHKDPEVANRVAMILGNFDGVIVLEVIADSQAERLGLRLGDLVVKVNQVKITPANHSISLSGKNARTLLILRDGKTLTINIGQGEIGIRFAYCKMAKGGEKWASGLAALGEKRYRHAYSLLSEARTEGVYNGLTTAYLACLAEYTLDHKRAMEIAGTVPKRRIVNIYPPPSDPKLKNRVFQDLPLRSLQTAFLLEQMKGIEFSPAWAAGYAHFMWAGRNFPLAFQASNHVWPKENKHPMQYFYNRTRMFVALHHRRYADTIKERKSLPQDRSWMDCLVVVAAVNGRDVKAAGNTARMILSQDDWFFDEGEIAYTLYAIAAAAAAGSDDLLDTLLGELKNLPPEKLDAVLKNNAAYCLHHLTVTPKLLPILLKAAGDGKYENINYELLRQLSIKPGLTIEEWNGFFKRYGSTTKATRDKFLLLNANALLRMRQIQGTKHKGQTVFITTGGRDLEGIVQMCRGAKKGSLWAMRYDGKCFYIDSVSSGAVYKFPGMSPGQIHDPLAGDRIVVLKTGTICVRRTQVYLFDEQAKRWLPTFAAPPKVRAATNFFANATAPAALKYVLKHYPTDGAGRECLGATETGQWRCYYFNGDIAIAVNKKTYQAIDLGRHVGDLAGLEKRAAVYNPDVFGDKDKTLLCPTEAGAWILSDDGKLSRIELPIKDQNVMTIRMPYPAERDGKLHIGVAPQQGGEIFEYDTKTGKVSTTGGYCGLGPDDSFFVISRIAQPVRCEYAIQTLYEHRLAGKKTH